MIFSPKSLFSALVATNVAALSLQVGDGKPSGGTGKPKGYSTCLNFMRNRKGEAYEGEEEEKIATA